MSDGSTKEVILVTGANKGIGYETARQLSLQRPHCTVLLGTRTLDNGWKAVQRMRDEHTAVSASSTDTQPAQANSRQFDNIQPIELDIADRSSIERAVQQVKAEHGHINVLINNSGISNGSMVKYDNGVQFSTAEVMAVNVYGTRDVTNGFLPLMPAGQSHVVVVSSELASWVTAALPSELRSVLLSPTLEWSTLDELTRDWSAALNGHSSKHEWPPGSTTAMAYGPSKALVSAYTRLLSRDQNGQRTVVAVTPGLCATPLSGGVGRSAEAGGASVFWPIGRWGEVEQGAMYQDGKLVSWCHTRPPQK